MRTEIYTVMDPWGFWWSSVVSPEEGYVCHGVADEKTMELRTLDYIAEGYGIDDTPSDIIEDDEVITTWADDVIRGIKTRPKPKPNLGTIERGEDPSLLDVQAELEVTLDMIITHRKRSDQLAHLRFFAEKIWDAAEEATAEDISKCCGCSGSDKELNPFKERRASDG